MNTLTIFKGTSDEREVTSENVENLYKHFQDTFDELQVYRELIPRNDGGDAL